MSVTTCPHCGYTHGTLWENEKFKEIHGKDGDFYSLPIEMEREHDYYTKQTRQLYACPSCKKTFIE